MKVTKSSMTDGQRKQATRFLNDAVSPLRAALDSIETEGMAYLETLEPFQVQRILTRFNQVKALLPAADFAESVLKKMAELSKNDHYSSEQVKVAYGYPVEYRGMKPIDEQIRALGKALRVSPDHALAFARTIENRPRHRLAEGPMAMISPWAFGTYCETASVLFEALAKSRKEVGDSFYNYRGGQIVPDRFRLSESTEAGYREIEKVQEGPIWIIDAQVGREHGGKSPRYAVDCFEDREFGFDAVAGGGHAIVHPERYKRWEELDLDLPGTETAPDQPGVFSHVACLKRVGGKLGFVGRRLGFARVVLGAGSFFLPPQALPAE